MITEISSMTDRFFGYFGTFFALLPPDKPRNQNFEKNKKAMEILPFYTCVP